MGELTHLSLFSGIGGLDLAAEWAGFKTIGQCEWADYPTRVLEKRWPDVPRWKDIRTLTGESFYERTGLRTVDIVSGGFPCQPFSVAGKQRGKEDDRYLWPEMVRVIKELRPTWVVGENVAGIVRMALPDILSELEGIGYRTRTFLIPACAVGARHRRYRVAIVGYSNDERGGALECINNQNGEEGVERRRIKPQPLPCRSGPNVGYTEHNGLYASAEPGVIGTAGNRIKEREETSGEFAGAGMPGNSKGVGGVENESSSAFRNSASAGLSDRAGKPMGGQGTPEPEPERPVGRPAQSILGGVANGISDWMDGDLDFFLNHYWDDEPDIPRIANGISHRADRLKCLGNAVVPQQFYPIFKTIAEIENKRFSSQEVQNEE